MPRVFMILARWTAMVLALRSSAVAISLFDLPSTIICKTSSSRWVRAALRSPRSAAFCSTFGSKTVSPAAIFRIAGPNSRSIAFLRTYPLAPASMAWRTQVLSLCMLSMRTAVSGLSSIICRVASSPFIRGNAQSMTTTCGRSCLASLTDSSPSPASPTTSMSGSSSSMRRKPRRTRLWSSTSKTVIFFGIRLRFLPWDGEVYQCSAIRGARDSDSTAHQFGTFAHRDQTDTAAVWAFLKTATAVAYFEFKRLGQKTQSHPRLLCTRMPSDVVQGLLQNAIHVNTCCPVYRKGFPLLLIGYGNSGLSFHGGDVPIKRAFEASFVEHDRVQCLRQAADVFQRRLDNLQHFLQVGSQT